MRPGLDGYPLRLFLTAQHLPASAYGAVPYSGRSGCAPARIQELGFGRWTAVPENPAKTYGITSHHRGIRNAMENNENMNKEFIDKIQKRVINLLKTLSDDLQVVAKDRCSEIARLVGCWILNWYPEYKAQIYKGELSGGLAHDVLVIGNDRSLFIIDPTIWQMFPESKSIFIGFIQDIPAAVSLLKKRYGGLWKISETMGCLDENYQQELLKVIMRRVKI